MQREPCAIEPQLLQPEQLCVEHGEPLQDLVLGHGTQVERDTMRDRRFELRTVDAQERNVRVLSASRLFFGPDDADDAVAVFALTQPSQPPRLPSRLRKAATSSATIWYRVGMSDEVPIQEQRRSASALAPLSCQDAR